jgi:ribosome maturation factor RimP
MSEKEVLDSTIQAGIETLNPEIFVVEASLKLGKRNLIQVLVDTEEGISLETCAKLNRFIGQQLEDHPLFDFPYTLEVSSPGIEKGLKFPKQYTRNIGRELNLTLTSGLSVLGKLTACSSEFVVLKPAKEKKEKEEKEDITIPFSTIKEAKVMISFKEK